MAKSSTSFQKGNPGGGRPRLTDDERRSRELIAAASPAAVNRIIAEVAENGPHAVKCAMWLAEHAVGKPKSAPEDLEAMAPGRPPWLNELSPADKVALIQASQKKG